MTHTVNDSLSPHTDSKSDHILLIAGCIVAYTPVVNAYLSYAREMDCQVDVVEYKNFKRLRFIFDAIAKSFTRKYTKIICVNHQSLPILLLLSWLTSRPLTFWKLESYKPFDNWSVALNLQLLEFLINRNAVSLIVPTSYRAKLQSPRYKHTYVVPNAPTKPYVSTAAIRKTDTGSTSLVLYGSIHKGENVFLNEWITFCESNTNCKLSIIGKEGVNSARISWIGKLQHNVLIDELCDPGKFCFSIVGYRATSQNNKYAAPNKLIESLACGLPVIGHTGNPYVVEVINKYGCGLIADFDTLDLTKLNLTEKQYACLARGAFNAAKQLCLVNAIEGTPLAMTLK